MIIEYKISDKERKKAVKIITSVLLDKKHFLRIVNLSYRLLCILVIVPSLLIFIPSFFKVYGSFPEYTISLLTIMLGIVIYFSGKQFISCRLKIFNQFKNANHSLEINENEIVFMTAGHLKTTITNNNIICFKDIDHYLLIFVQESFVFFIPPSAFSDDSARNLFKEKLKFLINK